MSLQHLILGVLKYGATSGYDLHKAFGVSVEHFWATDQSQIYRALYKMHELGWIDVEIVAQENSPAKKIYCLTETGRAELRRWLVAPLPIPALHEGWLGQLFFAAELSHAQIRAMLEARIAETEAMLAHYANEVPSSAAEYAGRYNAHDEVRWWLLTLDYGIEKARFDLQWARRALEQLQSEDDGL